MKTRMVVLSGGSGTRLWPLSREAQPKQFFDLGRTGKNLFIDTCERLKSFGPLSVVTTRLLSEPTMGSLKRFSLESEILTEPMARNTAAAVGWVTHIALKQDPQTVVGVFPADHLITHTEIFSQALKTAIEKASAGSIVTLGIRPTYPATGYGYMVLETPPEDLSGRKPIPVARFVEKPPKEIASELLSQGRSVWNAGMFVFRADTMAGEFRKHAPELWSRLESIKTDGSNLESIYSQLPPISIDYAVMERCHQIQCIPVDLGWSDVGSWEEILRADNRSGLGGKNIEVRAAGNFYVGHGTNIKRTAFVGVQDLIVVETPDALLVMQQGSGQDVKGVVDALKSEKSSLASRHSFEDRPWGRFEILVETPRYKSKRIIVWPGQRLSYQSHTKRAEHWVVVSGDAEVTLNDVVHRLKPGQSIDIPLGAKHRMANPGSEILEFIEVQTGTYFGEDDITRYQDNYGRK